MSSANVLHSTALGESSNANDSTYLPTTSQAESDEVNEAAGTVPLVLNYQFNQVNTGIGRENIVLPRYSKEAKRIRHFCILCVEEENQSAKISKDKRQANITRHWQKVHKRHRRIREINSATESEKKRLIKLLRNEGDQYFNNTLADKEGNFSNLRLLNLILTD